MPGIAAPDQQMQNLDYWPPLIAKLEQLNAQNPNDQNVRNSLANAYNNYGVLLAQNKQWNAAEANLQKALQISAKPNEIKKNLSNVYFSHGNDLFSNRDNPGINIYTYNNAKQLANQAIALNTKNVNALLLLGDIEYMEQNMPAAERAWQQAAALVPDNQDVQKRLSKIQRETSVETDMQSVFNPFFNIKIDRSVAQNPNFDINDILNYVHNKVAADFQYTQNYKVPVVVYNTDQYRQALVDAPGWAGAAYDGKIRIAITPTQKNFKQLTSDIIHEYTHVIIGEMTKNNCPRWFNEGLAKYEEYKHGVSPRIFALATAYSDNTILKFSQLNTELLSPNKNAAVLAYQQAFSFIYFIRQKYGEYNILQVLKKLGAKTDFNDAIKQAYGVSLDTLEKDWRAWLATLITTWAENPDTAPAYQQ